VEPNRPTKFDISYLVEAGKSYVEQMPRKLYIYFSHVCTKKKKI
jgi:hypothetical protein